MIKFLLIFSFISFISSKKNDGYVCAQFRHTKDRTSYAQTCAVYGLETRLPYWELVGTWNVWSTCRACGSPFHNFSHVDLDTHEITKGKLYTSKKPDEDESNDDPTKLNPCCIYGEAPYYDHDFVAVAINPNYGDTCTSTKYQFKLMGQWKTSHFYSPLSWCFWQTWYVTPNEKNN